MLSLILSQVNQCYLYINVNTHFSGDGTFQPVSRRRVLVIPERLSVEHVTTYNHSYLHPPPRKSNWIYKCRITGNALLTLSTNFRQSLKFGLIEEEKFSRRISLFEQIINSYTGMKAPLFQGGNGTQMDFKRISLFK